MNSSRAAEQSLREGDPAGALKFLQDEVRAKPADSKLRIFLFQLLAVLGQWDRALTQLGVAAELDPGSLAMAQTYREALHCEALRAQVFQGQQSPMVLGEPEQWLAMLIESLRLSATGQGAEARAFGARAFEQAPETAGVINGESFAWIADADTRLGPVLEAIINGHYYWLPFSRIAKLAIEAPEDLRDVVWLPAQIHFSNGGESVALIPTRYAATESTDDGLLMLARKTIWREEGADTYYGLGQRVISTDTGDVPLMEVREISLAVSTGSRNDG